MKKKWFIIAIIIVFLIKLFIVNGQILNIKGYSHDDGLFVSSAESILNNNWLGTYNDRTLSKGVSGILFIALSSKLKIPFLLAEQILYFITCISIIIMLKNIIKNKKILFLIFAILLMNPISYSDAFSFVYRDGLYTSLILLLIAYSFQIFFNYKENLKKIIFYSIIFGLIYGLIYLCREETSSLTPYIVCAGIITISFIFFDKKCDKKIQRVLYILFIPAIITITMITTISTINYKYYGRFITNDFTSKDFKDAYGAITRIKQKKYIKRVPLNEESREELYRLSPTFKELKPFLEGKGKKYFNKPLNDYQEGFLYWAVREGAYELGYYKDAKTSKEFYTRLTNEINELCDNKKNECKKKRSSLIAPIYPETIEELKIFIPKTFSYQITYKNVLVEIPPSRKANTTQFTRVTHNEAKYNSKDKYNISFMNSILKIYSKINPYIMIISLISYIFIMIRFFKKEIRKNYYKQVILLNGILAIYLIRIATIAFVGAHEYTSVINKCQYLAPTYPVQSLFSVLAIIFAIEQLTNIKKEIKNDK